MNMGRSHTHRLAVIASLCFGILALGALGLVLFEGTTHHVVKVVRVITSGRRAVPHGSPEGAIQSPLAPSTKRVAAELAKAEAAEGNHAQTGTTGAVLKTGASASYDRLVSTLPGRVELAVVSLGSNNIVTLGGDGAAHGWSTTKVPVLVALLRARSAHGLTATERSQAQAAITQSDNQSILDLFGDLEQLEGGLDGASNYIDRLFRMSGDEQTVVATASPPSGAATTFGQTEWRPSEAVKFFRALADGCLLPPAQTGYVLGLMQNIESGESWGLGSAGFSSVAFKGGWGPESSGAYLVRQSGIIDVGSSGGVAVSIIAFPASGSFSSGTEILTQTAIWLHHQLRLGSRGLGGCLTNQ